MTAKQKSDESYDGFSAEERSAMKERAQELKAAKRPRGKKGDPEAELLAKIAELPDADRTLAEGIHRIVTEHAPGLTPRTYYGMPAYAKDGKVLCFLQPAKKFDTRYATFGFNDPADLADGEMWPTAFAITKLTPEVEERIGELVRKAAG